MSFSFGSGGTVELAITIEDDADLNVKLEHEVEHLSDGPSDMDESFLEDFCILCLRKCPPGSEVTFCSTRAPNTIDVTEAQHKLTQALGIPIDLQYLAMCPTCWQLIELITEFKQCCVKATKKLKVLPMGLLDYDEQHDGWMAESTLDAIELKRQMIRKHMDQLDVEERKAKEASCQNMTMKKQANVEMEVEVSPAVDEDDVRNDAHEELYMEPIKPFASRASKAIEAVPLEEGDYKANIFSCETCGRNFDGTMSIRVHKTHCKPGTPSKEKYFSCPICTATFIENCGLTFHLNKHKGIRPYKCRKFCDHTFFSNFNRIKHERRFCEREGRICDVCGLQLKNEGTLKQHVENVHGEAKHACKICGQKFRSRKNHRLHMRVHSDERKFVCTVCNKAFKAPYSLKVHMRTHTQEMSYACHLCEQAFNYKVSLKNHIERHHGSNGSDLVLL